MEQCLSVLPMSISRIAMSDIAQGCATDLGELTEVIVDRRECPRRCPIG